MSFFVADGINVIWCIEKFEDSIPALTSSLEVRFPSSEIILELSFTSVHWAKPHSITIKRIDKCNETFKLCGSISAFKSANTIQLLEDFEFRLEKNCYESVSLEKIEGNSFLLDNTLPNNLINLLLQLCNSIEKKSSVTHHFFSQLNRQICNFEWILDTQTKKVTYGAKNTKCHVFLTKVPRQFTFDDRKNINFQIELTFESFSEVKDIYCFELKKPPFLDCIHSKLKIEAKSENLSTLNLINKAFYTPYDCTNFDDEKIKDLITNKSIFYPQRFLTLNIFFESVSYLKSEIEVDYLSSTKNIATLIERSNKFRHYDYEDNPADTLSATMSALYEEGQFCDVTLCIGEEKFPCHKSVLCARSPVFRAIFQNNKKEESNLVQISDINPDSFRIFLKALYSDSLRDVKWDDVWNVYETAVKYEIPAVRKICSKFLLSNLSMENVCQFLELSYIHEDDYLMIKIKKYITKHAKVVIKLPAWDDLISRNSLLAAKVMQEIFGS